MRRVLSIVLILLLSVITVGCGDSPSSPSSNQTKAPTTQVKAVTNGRYPVQQATYDDGAGIYTLMLLDTPPGQPSSYRTDNLRMARISDDNLAKGVKPYVEIQGNEAELYLSEDFKIEYVHNVTETQTDPNTGESRPVVVRRESSFWSPFAGALAGQALGSLLFRPQYYIPPIYSGGPLRGYGGYGSSYNQAVDTYRSRYNAPPASVKNRQTLRTTGNVRSPRPSSSSARKSNSQGTKSSGSGFGTSRLKSSGSSSGTKIKSNRSFGSSGSRSRSYSGGGRRRR